MNSKTSEKDYVTKTDIKERGWTDGMIKKLLPDPIEKRNAFHPGGPTIKLWQREIVSAVEQTEEWNKLYVETEKRRAARKEAILIKESSPEEKEKRRLSYELEKKEREELKRQGEEIVAKIEKYIQNVEIDIVPVTDIIFDSLQEKNAWVNQRSKDYFDGSNSCRETQERWAVNYIRHNLTDYDYYEERITKFELGKDIYKKLKIAVLNKIAEVYPMFEEECNIQKEKCLSK